MSSLALTTLATLAAAFVATTATGPLGAIDLPAVDLDRLVPRAPPGFEARVVTPDGREERRVRSREPLRAPPEAFPPAFLAAVLAAEDQRFPDHPGIDPLAALSALLDTAAGDMRGGSTITQQMVKNLAVGSAPTLGRKLAEAVLAVRAHAAYAPRDILAAYLASAWFGRGTTGAAAAAAAWFDRPWSELTLAETAFLAGLLKGAGHLDPDRAPDLARARRDYVLDRLAADGRADPAAIAAARASPLAVAPPRPETLDPWIARTVAAELAERARAGDGLPFEVPTLVATIDPVWQAIASEALAARLNALAPPGPAGRVPPELLAVLGSDPARAPPAALEALREAAARVLLASPAAPRAVLLRRLAQGAAWEVLLDRGLGLPVPATLPATDLPAAYWPLPGDILAVRATGGVAGLRAVPALQGAAVVLDPRTGAILAAVGGHDAQASAFNRALALRQPGSSIKAFLYLAALAAGEPFDAAITDQPIRFPGAGGASWQPQNYGGGHYGRMPLYSALERSSNIAAVRLADRIGIEAMAAMAEAAGVYPAGGMTRNLVAALGASEVTLVALTAGYGALVTGGLARPPSALRPDPRLPGPPAPVRRIADPEAVWDVLAMLRGVVVRGTAAGAFAGHPVAVAGKTGTSQDHRDAWFVGIVPGLAVGVWVGRDDYRPMAAGMTGGVAAAPVVARILAEAHARGLVGPEGMAGALPPGAWPPPLLAPGRRSPAPAFPPLPAAPGPALAAAGGPGGGNGIGLAGLPAAAAGGPLR
ncbi:MAG: transglycosylase domain-containing protein [Rhodobacteraceae bacterium]|nr:transglycosylase domain-containing protein [Paracoccaceae bacterium]